MLPPVPHNTPRLPPLPHNTPMLPTQPHNTAMLPIIPYTTTMLPTLPHNIPCYPHYPSLLPCYPQYCHVTHKAPWRPECRRGVRRMGRSGKSEGRQDGRPSWGRGWSIVILFVIIWTKSFIKISHYEPPRRPPLKSLLPQWESGPVGLSVGLLRD